MGKTKELRLFALGLTETEHRLLNSIVSVSQRRTRHLTLVKQEDAATANVMILATGNADATRWIKEHATLVRSKAVIWINAKNVPDMHLAISRPVQWSQLLLHVKQAIQKYRSYIDYQAESSVTKADNQQSSTAKYNQLKSTAQTGSTNMSRILIVDDSWAVRRHLSTILEQKHYKTTLASDGSEAVNEFSADAFDCVLMDVVMPEVDGYEACRQIKKLTKGRHNVPVIMLTSKTSPFDKIRGKMAGCDAYLTKPVNDGLLQEILDKHVIRSKMQAMSNR